jgi:hypothetical protein
VRHVGANAQQVPAVVPRPDLPLAGQEPLEDLAQHPAQIGNGDLQADVGDRSPDVSRKEAEDPLRHRAESPDPEVTPDDDDGDLDVVDEVRQVVVELAQLEVAAPELVVERHQLLVRGLDLLLGRLELLVDALELLVGGLRLLVRRLKLLDRRVVLLGDGLQVLARALELALGAGGVRLGRLRLALRRRGGLRAPAESVNVTRNPLLSGATPTGDTSTLTERIPSAARSEIPSSRTASPSVGPARGSARTAGSSSGRSIFRSAKLAVPSAGAR